MNGAKYTKVIIGECNMTKVIICVVKCQEPNN